MAENGRAPTIIDVADAAGVSKSAVSRVLSGRGSVGEDTRQRVLDTAQRLGYTVNGMARAMSAHRTYTLGAFVRDASSPFYGHLLTGLQERASAHGYRVVTATGSGRFALDDEVRAVQTLLQLRVEALIICSSVLPVDAVATDRIPVIVAGRPESDPRVTSVFCDEEEGGRGLAEHVASFGHRRVAVIQCTPSQSSTMATRATAMTDRLRELGVQTWSLPERAAHDLTQEVDAVLADGRTTALMTPSDRHAVGALEALARRGLHAPHDLSVSGYDGLPPLTTPLLGLTSWAQPVGDIGRWSVDAVIARLEGRSVPRRMAMSGALIAGRTTGPVPDH